MIQNGLSWCASISYAPAACSTHVVQHAIECYAVRNGVLRIVWQAAAVHDVLG
jgi:hypothetical protein